MLNYQRVYIYYIYIYIWEKCGWLDIWKMGKPQANLYHLPHPVFSSILYVHVSEMLCTFSSSCARFAEVVHVSQKFCTFHRSCARFTSPLIMFVFNCIGGTKHVLLCIYIYIHKWGMLKYATFDFQRLVQGLQTKDVKRELMLTYEFSMPPE